jgi:hypothetical protein
MSISVNEDRAAPAQTPRGIIETLAPRHRYLQLDEPPGDVRNVTVSAWAQPVNTHGQEWQGRANVAIGAGPFRVSLSPTVAQMRALATLLSSTADDQEMIEAGRVPNHQADELITAVENMLQGRSL